MAISTAETLPEVDWRLHAEAGTVVRPGPGEWRWRAPARPGLYPVALEASPDGSYPKYLVLDPRLLQKLERVADGLHRRGIPPGTLHVMSGYRTPYRNALLGNVPFSLHQWGRAADVFVDANGDGAMDDLNGDGRVDSADARLLADIADDLERTGGGVGVYPATAAHGPFVHVDVRPRPARWEQ